MALLIEHAFRSFLSAQARISDLADVAGSGAKECGVDVPCERHVYSCNPLPAIPGLCTTTSCRSLHVLHLISMPLQLLPLLLPKFRSQE